MQLIKQYGSPDAIDQRRYSPPTVTGVAYEYCCGTPEVGEVCTSHVERKPLCPHGGSQVHPLDECVLEEVGEPPGDARAPQTGMNGATGLYCGEQDLFCFLIDPTGWTEIEGEQFAPGFFVWNSEVGRRSLGISSFWFQRICQNHIVWDAIEVVDFTRKHTGNVGESLNEMRRIIEAQVQKRDARKDGFVSVIRKAMEERAGENADEATKFLLKQGIGRDLVKRAVLQLGSEGRSFTLWTLVDALTHLNCTIRFAGDRTDADSKVSQLLSLAV